MSERHVTLDIIVAAVSAVTGIDRRDIMAETRVKDAARARFAVYWLAEKMIDISRAALGRALGDRDHSTIILGIARAEELRAQDIEFRQTTDLMLGTLLAIEKHGLLRLAQTVDPVATAQRVLSHPTREAVRVSAHEIIALCEAVLADAPTTSPEQETDHAA
ncbi:helix-turn-helix domain-containing protein [Bosea sp. 685]|uniref:helix-turn-helix domain-containing protein n=1 Tax=Bosea sp. 685 TaxID=3080057 RepID=UPI0028936A69|nr:helix-turn-helix domain-containing protein [Bosea sp. 685]WNJ89140.1 helix-turn-helix domain-containing protein [Bosea sp. 685]